MSAPRAISAKVTWDSSLRFTGTNGNGLTTEIDGDRQTAASPLDLLLEAIGSCAATDVVMILEKQKQPLERLEVYIDADRHSPEPRYLTAVRLRFDAWGEGLSAAKVARAVSLSVGKYCSVYHSIRKDAALTVEYRLNATEAQLDGGYSPLEIAVA